MRSVLLLLLVVTACGSGESPGAVADTLEPSDTGAAMETGAPSDARTDTPMVEVAVDATDAEAPAAGYPKGPYGKTVGSVVADLGLEGYVRFDATTGLASTATYGVTSFADLRARSPHPYAIVHVSGFT